VVEQIITRHGGCDILINNAAIGSQRSFDSINFDMLRQMLAINVEAPFLLSQGLVEPMRRRGWGRIVNITTGALNLSLGGFVDYLMSKGALLGFTRALASELGSAGITVNAIAPGLVKTPMTLGGRAGHAKLPEMMFDAVTGMQSIKRSQMPADLVGTMSFLTSDDAGFLTGQVIYCDGGVVRV
jgi:NAD(P)-dependent dehydrogenase (short-subunit alcohol dehydrogenase family)